jgi:hypothetical protein
LLENALWKWYPKIFFVGDGGYQNFEDLPIRLFLQQTIKSHVSGEKITMRTKLVYQKFCLNQKLFIVRILLILGTVLVSSCMPTPPITDSDERFNSMETEKQNPPGFDPEPAIPTDQSREERLEKVKTPKVTPVNLSQNTDNPVIGEVPEDILEKIMIDLTNKASVLKEEIEVVRAQSVVWSDGSLGCPKPGAFYTQALVDGYWVVLVAKETEYDYRVSDSGSFIICENNGAIPISPPDDPSQKE